MKSVSTPFEAKLKNQRKLVLALLKLGFSYEEALNLSENEAYGYLDAYMNITETGKIKAKVYRVRRKNRKGQS